MNEEEIITSFLEQKVNYSETLKQLVKLGIEEDEAKFNLFIAAGGSDLVLVEKDGTERYKHSGKTVEEVEAFLQ